MFYTYFIIVIRQKGLIVTGILLLVVLFRAVPIFAQETTPTVTVTTSPSSSSSAVAGPIPPLHLVVRPKAGVKDTYIINQANAQLIGASGGSGGVMDASGIVGWAQKINDALEPGYDYGTGEAWYDKMVADICNSSGYCAFKAISTGTDNLYWCTFTVIDAFNLAGKTGLKEPDHLAVIEMVKFWKSTSGYTYIDYAADHKAALQQVKPGYPFFLANDLSQTINEEHTGIVKEITLDTTTGDGSIVTLESNSTAKTHTFPISSWEVQGMPFTLQGFGG